nr:hypothetical protein HK105_005766 [Polyrhizophydium stewartii]
MEDQVQVLQQDTNAQFFGSQTLCNKLRDSWATFPPQLVEDIQRALVEFASSPERSRWQWFLTAKAVQATLIQDAVRLFGSKMSAAEAAGDTAAAIHFTKAMLETTALVPEEAGRIELPEPAK